MKHGHIMMAMLLVALFLFQATAVFIAKRSTSEPPVTQPKPLKIVSHVLYALVIVTGLMTAMPLIQAHAVPHWLYAKLVLLAVAISATVKALRPTTAPNQAKIGMLIALIAYLGILLLAFIKPMNLF